MIKLVDTESVKRYETEGSAVLYKEILPRELERIYQKYQSVSKKKKFDIDFDAAKAEVLEKYVIGWEGVTDSNGVEVPYKPEYLDAMPSDVRNSLFSLIANGKLPDSGEEDENF